MSAQGWSVWRSCSPSVPCPGTGNRQEEKPAVLTLQSPLMVRTAAGNAHKASREVGSERPSGYEDESSEHLWYPSFSPCPDTAASWGSGCTVSCQHNHSFRLKKICLRPSCLCFVAQGSLQGCSPALLLLPSVSSCSSSALAQFVLSWAQISAQLQPRAGGKLQAGVTLLQ